MKRILYSMAAVSLLAVLTSCASNQCNRSSYCSTGGCSAEPGCASCGEPSCGDTADPGVCEDDSGHWCGLCCRRERMPRGAVEAANPGPPSGAVTYPYYTNRGPRDYLAREVPSIGP
ncbi:MAG: hypothetical protein JXB10_05445 [Pirellulales bacterium]|nr:hypothetical protein [Pirellulales bacterium]